MQKSAAAGSKMPVNNNLQRIKLRKQTVYMWEKEKKLFKLGVYSKCQECPSETSCKGWKPQKNSGNPTAQTTCCGCNHTLAQHYSHLETSSDEELNKLLGMVVDIENIYICMNKQQDKECYQVYYAVYRKMRESIVEQGKVTPDWPMEKPPFELPTISKGAMNFILYKFSHLTAQNWSFMHEFARMFVHSLNHWNFEMPSARRAGGSSDDLNYSYNYSRWLMLCQIPFYCDSLTHYEPSKIFGVTLLRAIFKPFKAQLVDKFNLDKSNVAAEKRQAYVTSFNKFIDAFEQEVFSPSSPVWDPDFKCNIPPHLLQLIDRKNTSIDSDSCLEPPLEKKKSESLLGKRKDGGDVKSKESKRQKANHSQIPEDVDDLPRDIVDAIIAAMDNPSSGPDRYFKEDPAPYNTAKADEEAGIIKVEFVSNSIMGKVSRRTMLHLIKLLSVFHHQLPKIPIDYITRFVFDPKHKTLALLKRDKIIGGICFRLFQSQGFSEIVFCALSGDEQLQGYGTYLMNHLKEYHLRINIKHFLTYADEHAIGYFKKQGFNEEVNLDSSVYKGFVKSYDKATFMHCQLNPKIVYTELPIIVQKQKKVLTTLIAQKKIGVEKVYDGLTCFKDGLGSTIGIDGIPGIKETRWKQAVRNTRVSGKPEETIPAEELTKKLKTVLDFIKRQDEAPPFLAPVDKFAWRDYYDIIKYPMDLQTMTKRLNERYYVTRRLFIADMMRIFNNCRIYNESYTDIYHAANRLEKSFKAKMREVGLWDK